MLRITELEEQLANDECGLFHKKLLTQLECAKKQLKEKLFFPQFPTFYEAVCLQIEACDAASFIISTLWRRYHAGILHGVKNL